MLQIGFDLTLVCPQWFVCNFVTSCRMDVTARIWDLVLFAGKGGIGESGGILVWTGMAILNAIRDKVSRSEEGVFIALF